MVAEKAKGSSGPMLGVQDRLSVRQSAFARLATQSGQSGPASVEPNESLNLASVLATVAPRACPSDTDDPQV